MKNHEPRHDERGLTPERDPLRWEALVHSITAAAEAELARRAAQVDPLLLLAGWTRPLLATAATLVILASAALVAVDRGDSDSTGGTTAEAPALAEALLPSTLAAWVEGAHAPTAEELVVALEEAR